MSEQLAQSDSEQERTALISIQALLMNTPGITLMIKQCRNDK